MPNVVPAFPTVAYTDRNGVESLLSAAGISLRTDDDQSGDDSGELVALDTINKAVALGTSRVNLYLSAGGYNPSDLARSWTVWHAATVIAARWLSMRRGNPAPQAIEEEYKEYVGTEAEPGILRQVALGRLALEDAPRDLNSGPAWSNVIVDPSYRGKQVRVLERQSEQTPRERPPARDWFDAYLTEP